MNIADVSSSAFLSICLYYSHLYMPINNSAYSYLSILVNISVYEYQSASLYRASRHRSFRSRFVNSHLSIDVFSNLSHLHIYKTSHNFIYCFSFPSFVYINSSFLSSFLSKRLSSFLFFHFPFTLPSLIPLSLFFFFAPLFHNILSLFLPPSLVTFLSHFSSFTPSFLSNLSSFLPSFLPCNLLSFQFPPFLFSFLPL
ncbi:unnamed protein product [Acanthosepion pharaonis]|uniref:Uncharacterized protein n=1 Tax=Acanthosepion pharaonis TaxID=158019 RepID=A0A812ATF3_ACAPH|nr:unnamed protein product [Sepia pharaonis]